MDIKILALTVLIHACLSLKNFQLGSQYESQSQSTTGDFPFPGNYTLREVIATQFNAKNVLLSPDQNWVLYQDLEAVYSNSTTFYFRHRRSFESKSIKLGNDKFDALMSWKFNKRGDFLFAGTYYGFVYMCNFSQNMTSSDCQTRFSFNRTAGLYSFSINEANQLALIIRDQFYVLTLSESGALVSVASRYFPSVFGWISVSWHPQHSDMVIIGSCESPIQMKGFISFFNITTNSSQDRQLYTCVSRIIVFNKENIIITLDGFGYLNAFLYEGTNLNAIGINKDLKLSSISLSVNQNLLIGYKDAQSQIQVFTVTKLLSPLGTKHQGKLNVTNDFSGIQLDLVYSQDSLYEQDYSFSDDGNQFLLISDLQRPLIKFYSMCPRGTYFTAEGCFKCGVNCSACHITIDSCTDCLNNTFALFNNSCLNCGVYLNGCLTCLNAHSCLSCDEKNNFSPNPANGSCICKDFYFLSNGKCEPCQPYTICRVCASETVCTECDLYKGYKQKPVDSSCVCRRQFSTVNNTCVECDIEGCERCENVNVCMFCLQSQGFEPDVGMDGICVKKSSYSLVIILSIIGGCALVGIATYVYCMLRKRKSYAKNELKDEPDFEEKASESSEIHRMSAPKFEEIEEMIKQSIEKQIKMEKIPVINKKEYAKISDAQKIQLRHLLKESLLSIR